MSISVSLASRSKDVSMEVVVEFQARFCVVETEEGVDATDEAAEDDLVPLGMAVKIPGKKKEKRRIKYLL